MGNLDRFGMKGMLLGAILLPAMVFGAVAILLSLTGLSFAWLA